MVEEGEWSLAPLASLCIGEDKQGKCLGPNKLVNPMLWACLYVGAEQMLYSVGCVSASALSYHSACLCTVIGNIWLILYIIYVRFQIRRVNYTFVYILRDLGGDVYTKVYFPCFAATLRFILKCLKMFLLFCKKSPHCHECLILSDKRLWINVCSTWVFLSVSGEKLLRSEKAYVPSPWLSLTDTSSYHLLGGKIL